MADCVATAGAATTRLGNALNVAVRSRMLENARLQRNAGPSPAEESLRETREADERRRAKKGAPGQEKMMAIRCFKRPFSQPLYLTLARK